MIFFIKVDSPRGHKYENVIFILVQFQLDAFKEEGLFRIASSTLKIKRLAALFDTGETSDLVIKEITDPHVFSGKYSYDYK